ncbi:MAG: acetyl-CoA C-acetyltransferase [Methanobacteriota archaeon]|jgi:acetyl-CoA C-acetyltransferase|uniref:Thiolase domain-containing protein n=1 Tax=Halorutilus salinus TaxID=2487751 RepID=A0A9Q4C401_9EURY|nr:thiolase domain-containing protein [Halorutilus salinus]MCX2818672.1 thiolase domain-containing protein [Halorutilus salinus]
MQRNVAVVGVGQTAFGEHWERSFRDLFVTAGVRALEDAGVGGDEIDAMYGGNMSAGQFIRQEHVAALIADYAGLATEGVPATRVEAADASGGLAFRQAVLDVASGASDVVVASGVEKMTDLGSDETNDALAGSADREWEVFGGGNVAALYALMARAHMNRYGTTRRELSQVAVKNHRHASGNEYAQYTNEVSAEVVESTPYVAEPLRAFDCSPASDGAAAVVVVPAEDATAYVDDPVYVEATEQASDSLTVHDRRDITALDATSEAAERAYAEANFSPGDIDFAEVHDSYTIGEVLAVEDLGFAEKGEGGGFIDEGRASVGGETPVNPSGGLKACGHPLGATGVRQVVDATRQLRGDAGTQVEDGSVAVTQNVGGTGGTAVVNVLSDGGSV